MKSNIQDSPIARIGSYGLSISTIYRDMEVVWDFSNEEYVDLMIYDPKDKVFKYRCTEIEEDWSPHDIEQDLKAHSDVLTSIPEVVNYCGYRRGQEHVQALKTWLKDNDYTFDGLRWKKSFDPSENYEE